MWLKIPNRSQIFNICEQILQISYGCCVLHPSVQCFYAVWFLSVGSSRSTWSNQSMEEDSDDEDERASNRFAGPQSSLRVVFGL